MRDTENLHYTCKHIRTRMHIRITIISSINHLFNRSLERKTKKQHPITIVVWAKEISLWVGSLPLMTLKWWQIFTHTLTCGLHARLYFHFLSLNLCVKIYQISSYSINTQQTYICTCIHTTTIITKTLYIQRENHRRVYCGIFGWNKLRFKGKI